MPTFIACLTLLTSAIAGQDIREGEQDKLSITLASPVGQLLADNREVSGRLDTESGRVHVDVMVNGFHFVTPSTPDYINKSTTKRFREYYLETDKFPDASFTGRITDLKQVDFSKAGSYPVEVKGEITLHGVTREMVWQAAIMVTQQQVRLRTDFTVALHDFKVRVPEIIQDVFFKTVDISLNCRLKL